ncbi:hypothetical protein [Aquimarina sp. RZ0]|uniref:hypothetical protein n=1 Tax=Aquimarina sp. RZ0 TaxID=2607730 RepID=UPI0011F1DA7B|nr:hypothetical protein [Aquimarina sp. RZ0]KAA1247577.1 hypothetical protein F0000_01870 [Aquimarina sp. RZ0]
MKKDKDIAHFSVVYLLLFTLLYASIFHSLKGWYIFLWILMVSNFPSLLAVLLLVAFERLKGKRFSSILYFLVSIVIHTFVIAVFQREKYDSKNIFPVVEESVYVFLLLSIASHFLAFMYLLVMKKMIKRFKNRFA